MKVLKQKRHNLVATTALSLSLAVTSLGVPRANAADFDWKQAQGSTINISFNQHPYADAIIQQLPKFKFGRTHVFWLYRVPPVFRAA
jgi:hypothetical protein